ncbi:MAG: Hsp70 family protein [Chitinophagaceae bacterium]
MQQLSISEDEVKNNKVFAQAIRLKAEEAKKHLSIHETFHDTLNGNDVRLSQIEFENLIKPLVDKTIVCCKNALKDAGLVTNDIEVIVMVGGSTRIPFVKKPFPIFWKRSKRFHES